MGPLLALACGGDGGSAAAEATSTDAPTTADSSTTVVGSTTTMGSTEASTSTAGDTTTGEPAGPWVPGDVYPTPREPNPRGFLERRGLVHTHSPYSHDACDGEPLDAEGNPDPTCLEDLRRDMCLVQHDFMMLTDHDDSFAVHDFPDVLLFDPARGDELIDRGGPVANWVTCPSGPPLLVMAGTESGLMPVGLERHVVDAYDDLSPEAASSLREAGAVVLLAHPEDYDLDTLATLPVDGFEMYNLHANTLVAVLEAAQLLQRVYEDDPGLPHPDLAVFVLWSEDPRYLERWGGVLARGGRPVTTMGTDAHRNTFPQLLPDGERVDSFRRMQQWFSNHLLVAPDAEGGFDDLALKDALRAGRLFGVFEYLGYPEGFDARVETSAATVEIGGEVSLGDAPEIVAVAPTVAMLDPEVTPPEITLHLMRAIDSGFEELAMSDTGELRHVPDAPGAYRVEVRITPHHLETYLGDYADRAAVPRVWIYANPFFVVD
jgi:hypothetical protein